MLRRGGQPPGRIDGVYSRLFVVRDLASGKQLMALPCEHEDQQTVLDALKALIKWHGRPLVIKSDNGGALRGENVMQWLECQEVRQLFSPRGTPRYNGACEAGIGSLKTRVVGAANAPAESMLSAGIESARNDSPGEWTCDGSRSERTCAKHASCRNEAARCQANDTARRGGWKQPTPSEMWRRRGGEVSDVEREKFNQLYARYEAEVRKEQGWMPTMSLSYLDQSAIDRVAVSRALMDCGYLTVRRRRITPPIASLKATKIS